MTPVTIVAVVEGHGEVDAVPRLIQRIAAEWNPMVVVRTPTPIRHPKDKLVSEKDETLARAVELAAAKAGPVGGVFILIDADEHCPATLGPRLRERATGQRPDLPVGVVLANVEYEAWFLAASVSLRGKRGLPADLNPPPDPEAVGGAKEWIERQTGKKYSETIDQAAFTSLFDLNEARQAPSFDKCYREVTRLLDEAAARADNLQPIVEVERL